ncbi:MAG: AraC family transcriptional regulator [Gammaproteobacteria bacterium]|uniref:Transcriptional regulator, AraC family n=1 Tax=Marinobacter nitratireducens TaxID=1137280 RepID=A0A072NG01_9GAMM|nr:AraC family transcriptional regulator [Marinobacter nitratireducens]KEF32040.1 Transcriptional regulator, AraC family [Marinobacter nitratireducens]TNE79600.1 MAG: AraC family transcriptional regulator [Gammaproteobacteria bacterium]TNE96510.1 MAG: AraC family transcriptional regulator [Gammaproteobacteria bacterium]
MLDARLLKLPIASHQHRHEHHQIVVGVQGEADLSVDGTGSHLDTWRACLVPTEARHDYCGDNQNHVLVINLDPYIPAINTPAHADYERLSPLFEKPRTLDMDNKLQGLVQFAAGEFDRAPENEGLKRHLAASILHCMAERLNDRRRTHGNRNALSPDTIRRYVMENLHRKISVRDLAGVACLSVSRFHELFRDVTGLTPHQFLLQARLEQAAQLLTSTSLSVSEVSFRTGFSSQGALTNALKKHKGTTPTKLRFGEKVA